MVAATLANMKQVPKGKAAQKKKVAVNKKKRTAAAKKKADASYANYERIMGDL